MPLYATAHESRTSSKGILDPAVAEVFARRPVYDNIFCRLSPASFARVSRTCRDVREATADFATRAYDINRRLAHYFSDPLAFRTLMARTTLLISGSFALQFFNRTFLTESDLDLYVHHDIDSTSESRVLKIANWLENEGYVFKPGPKQEPTVYEELEQLEEMDGIRRVYGQGLAVSDVFTFEKPSRGVNGEEAGRKVQIIIPSSQHASPLETILNFHSTCVMNVIMHNAAYSLYPYATFEHESSLVLTRDQSARTNAALEKYASRGFRILDPRRPSLPVICGTQKLASFFVGHRRQVADRNSWIIPLQKQKVVKAVSIDVATDKQHTAKADGRTRDRGINIADDDYEYDIDDEDMYDDDSEEYDDEVDECEEEEYDEDEDELGGPIPECRWRVRGDALPLCVEAVDYVGARDVYDSDEY